MALGECNLVLDSNINVIINITFTNNIAYIQYGPTFVYLNFPANLGNGKFRGNH